MIFFYRFGQNLWQRGTVSIKKWLALDDHYKDVFVMTNMLVFNVQEWPLSNERYWKAL